MMRATNGKALVLLFCFFSIQVAVAQTVPDRIEFAGMQLFFTKKAKARIQADVDMIKKSTTYFQQKVDRANLFFPVIEKVFTEEGFPAEFKYLALQESSLVSDAVSSSQAVGYWQFKKESAVEVGVKVDHRVDERMNIYASTKGAAKYLKRNQAVLNNWIYTLLSYNMGLGGVKSQVNNEYVGAQQMEIDDDMHWYVFRFLAHKIAYEGMVGNAHHSSLHLVGYKTSEQKKLQEIATEAGLDEQLVLDYNKWCLHKEIPGDREYTVILPVPIADREQYIAKYEKGVSAPIHPPIIVSQEPVHGTIVDKEGVAYTAIDEVPDWTKAPMRVSINRVKAVRISPGDEINGITLKMGISKEGFLRFNEITISHQLIPGNYYYLQLKRMKALVAFHTVKKGESVWSIAQHYGIKQGAILSKNRMDKNEALKEGRVLWLRDKRPKDTPIEYQKMEEAVIKPIDVKRNIVIPPIPSNDSSTPVLRESLPDNDKFIYHTVKQGETMFGISRSYYVSSDSILHWNALPDYSIKTGQYLIVGRKIKTPVKHVVKQGETLYKIAQLYKVDVNTILKNNNKTEASIKIGEELIISQ